MSAADLIQWSDEFSVNIQEIDEQHKVLVGLLNELHQAIREHHGKATSREILASGGIYTDALRSKSLMRLTHTGLGSTSNSIRT
jgi:hemerythrin